MLGLYLGRVSFTRYAIITIIRIQLVWHLQNLMALNYKDLMNKCKTVHKLFIEEANII